MQKGNSNTEGVIILAVLLIIILITFTGSGSNSAINSAQNSILNSSEAGTVQPNSTYARSISLGTGNSSYVYQPYEEYITINNRGKEAVNITGWQLKNGKDERAYDYGGSLRYFSADAATIPQAALFISPTSFNIFQNILLESGETAIVTTGQPGPSLPYKIVSFKENICSGYLEALPEYTFTPPLTRNCPRPVDELGVSALDTECRRFIERMVPCRTPEFNTRDRDGEICYGCIDGQLLSNACNAFIKNHFNYPSCIAYHQTDSNFSGRTWRIFLGKGWEMWAKEYETIKLFDLLGQLVASRSY
ncbi:MAG: hypothetical protein HYT68_00490 [Candidatus Zambryskibacteria bacterium]|nr:hypothetical protein [Candidatus Zambryskibacteria bacterium]